MLCRPALSACGPGFLLCAGRDTNLTGESPVIGDLSPSVVNHKSIKVQVVLMELL